MKRGIYLFKKIGVKDIRLSFKLNIDVYIVYVFLEFIV